MRRERIILPAPDEKLSENRSRLQDPLGLLTFVSPSLSLSLSLSLSVQVRLRGRREQQLRMLFAGQSVTKAKNITGDLDLSTALYLVTTITSFSSDSCMDQ
jgi:hypothetical protein